ncbi:MAG: hypothetical protein JXA57_01230 [Armatimonadetes bacterium]|nr:hypothetical protein [Armatimonadota bacterium]
MQMIVIEGHFRAMQEAAARGERPDPTLAEAVVRRCEALESALGKMPLRHLPGSPTARDLRAAKEGLEVVRDWVAWKLAEVGR